jgi:hypothetical protein
MAELIADGVEIQIGNGAWKLFNMQGTNTLTPYFYALRGEGVIHYTAAFGQQRSLPGDILGTDYIRAVVVGYDETNRRWLLGLQVQMTPKDKPRFVELVHWGVGTAEQNGTESHGAGRVLAEYLSVPLKLFGVKKQAQAEGRPVAGVTGPLEPHQRTNVDLDTVRDEVKRIELPLEFDTYQINSTRSALTLRLPREATGKSGELPAYQQCVVDKDSQTVKLLPPTGLLGSFFGPSGRAIAFKNVRNIELRHTIMHEATTEQDSDGYEVEHTRRRDRYGVYLTTSDESILLMQMDHMLSEELISQPSRAAGNQNIDKNMIRYLRHQQDAEKREKLEEFAEGAALVLADTVGRPLVLTTIGNLIDVE